MRAFRVALYLIAALAVATLAPTMPSAQIGVSITLAPPALPIYDQPPIPEVGYIWAPGYWAWGSDGYYWVPGTWVQPPQVGVLWTPGYWGWGNGAYAFNEGYWGPQVGFYGGINYGYGYGGSGYGGGYWNNGAFFYNRQANNFGNNTTITNVYTKNITNNITNSKVSFNGPGGATARMTAAQAAAARQPHVPPTAIQTQHAKTAAAEPSLRASVNHGTPPVAATAKPGVLTGAAVVPARTGAATAPTGAQPGRVVTPPPTRTPAPVGAAGAAHVTPPVRTPAPVGAATPTHVTPPPVHTPAPVGAAAPVHVAPPPHVVAPQAVAPYRAAPAPSRAAPAPYHPAPAPYHPAPPPHPAAAPPHPAAAPHPAEKCPPGGCK